jgi:hypothetical protein
MELQILVNHDSLARTDCDELVDDFEDCNLDLKNPQPNHSDCVDIWMQAGWMYEVFPNPHPLNDSNNVYPVLPDEFWLYEFQSPDALQTDEGAMRVTQSGLRMHQYGISGSANWAFWARDGANEYPEYVEDSTADATRHSWVKTVPRLWNQDTMVYFNNHDPSALNPSEDNSAPFDVPDGELLLPGRTVFARRQALEYRRLMRQLETVPGFGAVDNVLTTAAEQDLLDLIDDATHPCHESGECTTIRATPDELSMIVHEWLNAGHDGHGSCSSPPAVNYTTGSTRVYDAMNLNPWSL